MTTEVASKPRIQSGETFTGPNGKSVDKVERYKWTILDNPPEFEWIDKRLINIDHRYQREQVSLTRIANIRSNWSWAACGAILIVRRQDGSLWVYDGQHRLLAAKDRSDIFALPCLVFEMDQIRNEAEGFILANKNRGPMKAVEAFKADIIADDQVAVAVKNMVEASGYRIANNGQAKHTVSCVATLKSLMKQNAEVTKLAWELCVELAGGENITETLLNGFFFAELHCLRNGESLDRKHNREAIMRIGRIGLEEWCRRSAIYLKKGGGKVSADGVINALNQGRRTRRIPVMYQQ
jgi:hypothetical protein